MSQSTGQTCVFLRGLVRESGHWAGFLERFQEAFPSRRVIALDIPGNGRRFRERSPASITAMAEALRAEAAPLLGQDNQLFALSLGAMIGLQWMQLYPQDFSGAVLVNSSLRALSPFHHRLRPANYLKILGLFVDESPYRRERAILEMTSNQPDSVKRLAADWAALQELRPVAKGNALRQLWAAARFHPPSQKPSGKLLVLGGAGDRLVNPQCGQRMAELWGAPYHAHPTAGHDLTLDAPEWVIEQLKVFSRQ